MITFFRFQPPGLPLQAHTSSGSPVPVPPGFVFAWRHLTDAYPDWFWLNRDPPATEVIEFEADHTIVIPSHSDHDGILALPTREVRRWSLR